MHIAKRFESLRSDITDILASIAGMLVEPGIPVFKWENDSKTVKQYCNGL